MTRGFLLLLCAAAALAADPPDVTSLGWISGCWEMRRGPLVVEETWMKPAGQTMLGLGRTVREGRTVSYEYLRLHVKDGSIYYTARPSNAASETPFKLARGSDTEAVFENPEHDFPQRLIYRRLPDGSLAARIEGTVKGKQRAQDFSFQRVACP